MAHARLTSSELAQRVPPESVSGTVYDMTACSVCATREAFDAPATFRVLSSLAGCACTGSSVGR